MKIAMKRLMKDEKGKALILALILLAVGGLIIGPLLDYMNTGLLAGGVYERKVDELYAADAGVEDAIWKIMNDADELPNSSCGNQSWSYNYSILDINNKDVDVTIDYPGDLTHLITSTATGDDGSSTTINAAITLNVVSVNGSEFFDSDWETYEDDEYVLLEGEYDPDDIQVVDGHNIVLKDGATIGGNAWAVDGNIELGVGATIEGNVVAHGTSDHTVTLKAGAVINGTVCAGTIVLEEGARIGGTAYATCAGEEEMCATPYVPCDETGSNVVVKENAIIEGSAYAENGDVEVLGGQVWGDAYAAYLVKVESGGSVGETIHEYYEDWEGCPLCGTTTNTAITGVGIGYWQIS